MAPNSERGGIRRLRPAWLIAGAVTGLLLAAPVATAPSVDTTCAKLLELAAIAGEPVSSSDSEACEQHYRDQRARRGLLGWTWLSWCTYAAQSIPEAGEC